MVGKERLKKKAVHSRLWAVLLNERDLCARTHQSPIKRRQEFVAKKVKVYFQGNGARPRVTGEPMPKAWLCDGFQEWVM